MFRGPRLAAAKDSRQYVNRVFRQYAKPELMVWRRDLCRAFGIVVRIEKPDADGRILSGSDNKPAVEIGYVPGNNPVTSATEPAAWARSSKPAAVSTSDATPGGCRTV